MCEMWHAGAEWHDNNGDKVKPETEKYDKTENEKLIIGCNGVEVQNVIPMYTIRGCVLAAYNFIIIIIIISLLKTHVRRTCLHGKKGKGKGAYSSS